MRCSVKGEGLVVLPPPTQDRWAPLAPGHFLRCLSVDRGGQSGQSVQKEVGPGKSSQLGAVRRILVRRVRGFELNC